MTRSIALVLFVSSLLGGMQCPSSTVASAFYVRSLNLVPRSPAVEVDLDDATLFRAEYGSMTRFARGRPGQHTLSFSALSPSDAGGDDLDHDGPSSVSGAFTHGFAANTRYTFVVYGELDDIRTFVIEDRNPREDVADDTVILQFTHASSHTPAVDVFVTVLAAGTEERYHVDTLASAETSAPLELTLVRDEDDLEDGFELDADIVVELMAAGTTDLLYRSDSITLCERSRVMLAVADTGMPAPAARLLVVQPTVR